MLRCSDRGLFLFSLLLREWRSKNAIERKRMFFSVVEAEKLCTKCAEKFSQESLTPKLIAAQMPLLVTSLEVNRSVDRLVSIFVLVQVLSRLAEKHKSLATYAIRALCDFLTEPSPLLYKLYRQTSMKIDGQDRMGLITGQSKASK